MDHQKHFADWCQRPERIRIHQLGGGLKRVSRRSLMVVVAASVTGTILLVWLLLPILTTPVYHTVMITMEERNVLFTAFSVGEGEVRGFLPDKMKSETTSPLVFMYVGFGRLSVEGKSYDYVFARFHVLVGARVQVGPASGTPFKYYVLDFFSNSIELDELFMSYGFPHTYVKASYQRIPEDPMTRTSLTMTYPDGQPLLKLLAVTNETGEKSSGGPGMGGSGAGDKINLYHLNNNNLTFLHIAQRTALFSFHSSSHANITFAENTPPWRYAGRTAYAIRQTPVATITEYHVIQGKLGWAVWK